MIIGTDSIHTCMAEGYLIMGFDGRKLRDTKNVPSDYSFEFFETRENPEETRDPKTLSDLKRMAKGDDTIRTTRLTLSELHADYKQYEKDIDSCCDCAGQYPDDLTGYSDYMVLQLANDINAYCGIFSPQ